MGFVYFALFDWVPIWCEWTELNNNSEGQFKKNFQVEKRLVTEISFLHFSFELLYSFKFIT